jgi:REP-associated tyrosine transposase
MPRPTRINFDGAWHHVMNRGAAKRVIFHDPQDHAFFLKLLKKAHEDYGLEIHAWCLMKNHYHLLVRTPGCKLGDAMKIIGGVYTQYYNRKYESDGPVFKGRFKSVVVEGDEQLLTVSRYIHRNPVAAGLAKRPIDFEWSSYGQFAKGAKSPAWLYTDETLRLAEGTASQSGGSTYAKFVEKGSRSDGAAEGKRSGSLWSPILSSDPAARAQNREHKRVEGPGVEEILEVVALMSKLDPQALTDGNRGDRGAREARLMALWLSKKIFGFPNSDLAQIFGFGSSGAISSTLTRFGKKIEESQSLQEQIQTATKTLTRYKT